MGLTDKLACLAANLVTMIVMVTVTALYFTGAPLLRDIPFIGHVPLIGAIAEGEIGRRVEAATAGMATLAEKTALEAQLKEIVRQRDAYADAVADFEKRQAADAAADAARQKANQKEIADYEQKLEVAQRACYLDDSDRDFILRHQ
jgi:hypothetical protein